MLQCLTMRANVYSVIAHEGEMYLTFTDGKTSIRIAIDVTDVDNLAQMVQDGAKRTKSKTRAKRFAGAFRKK